MSESALNSSLGIIDEQVDRDVEKFHAMNRAGEGLFSESLRLMEDKSRLLTPYERVIGHLSLFLESLADIRLATRVGARQVLGNEMINDVRKVIKSARALMKESFKPVVDDSKKIMSQL